MTLVRSLMLSWLLLLTACAAPLLLMNPQAQLLIQLLKPMVGLDPNKAGLFEQPLIQDRLKPLLGPYYQDTIAILKTAESIQQQGPLLYLVSKDSPFPQVAEKAGFVFNSETNQMAVVLLKGDVSQVFAEQLVDSAQQQIPAWPDELSPLVHPAKYKQQLQQQAQQAVTEALPVDSKTKQLMEQAQQVAQDPTKVAAEALEQSSMGQAVQRAKRIAELQQQLLTAQQQLAQAQTPEQLKTAQQNIKSITEELEQLKQP